MNDPIGRGWRFVHPDMGLPESSGLCLSNRGGIESVRGKALIRQAIYLLLSTRRGERVMRPGYGCDLDRLIFLPNDATTAGLAIHYTRRALEDWEPRVEILSLDAAPDPEEGSSLEISLAYRVHASGLEDELTFAIDLAGEEG
ncbi:MAG: GPW/gp25 family protein [Acidobacteriota bacterium]